jgi:hypothetical protein
MTNQELINEFVYYGTDIDTARNGNGTLRIENGNLYSYELLIAEFTTEYNGTWTIHLHDYNINAIAKISGFRSMTTRQHIGMVKRQIQESSNNLVVFEYNDKAEMTNIIGNGVPV